MSANQTYFFTGQPAYDLNIGWKTYTDLHLIQQRFDISPALPKLNFVDMQGGDGSVDRTAAMGGVRYEDRTATWTFALYPGDNWHEKQTQISDALNGKSLWFEASEDPNHWYRGRISVSAYNRDRMLRQITVTARCDPWRYAASETLVTVSLTKTQKTIRLPMGSARVVPDIRLNQNTVIEFPSIYTGGYKTMNLTVDEAGVPQNADMEAVIAAGFEVTDVVDGYYEFYAKTATANSGSISFYYRKASL